MQTAAEKFIEVFTEKYISQYETRKEAYVATCEFWIKKYEFEPPFANYDSFKQMVRYYHRRPKSSGGVIGIDI